MRLRHAAAAALALALLATACTTDDGDEEAGPTTSTGPSTTTTIVDLSGVTLAPVPGESTTTIAERGRMRVSGTVLTPSGAAGGATVRFERFVGAEVQTREVTANAQGRYVFEDAPGGRYRVRAFLPPTFTQVDPVILFLAELEPHTLDLELSALGQVEIRSDVAPNPPEVDQPVNLVVRVGVSAVGPDGVLRTDVAPGVRVELDGLGNWRPQDGSSRVVEVTDANGSVLFPLRCEVPGDPFLFVRIPVQQGSNPNSIVTQDIPLDLPSCLSPPPPTTTTTTTEAPTTTTERPGSDDGGDDGDDGDDGGDGGGTGGTDDGGNGDGGPASTRPGRGR